MSVDILPSKINNYDAFFKVLLGTWGIKGSANYERLRSVLFKEEISMAVREWLNSPDVLMHKAIKSLTSNVPQESK